MENRPAPASTHLEACRRVAARFRRPWLRHYVSGKLRFDPVFSVAFDLLRESAAPLLDLGCGVGLLGFYLRERGFAAPIVGVDIDRRKIRQGGEIARSAYREVELREGDVRRDLPSPGGNVALLDLLHYLDASSQKALLSRASEHIAPGARMLLRDAPRDGSLRYWMTHAGERFAQTISWNVGVPLHFPTRAMIHAAFDPDEFTHEERPAFAGTPFNNHLFIFTSRAPGRQASCLSRPTGFPPVE